MGFSWSSICCRHHCTALWPALYCVLCVVYCILRIVYCISCIMYCVLCIVYCVLCIVYRVFCVVSILCIVRQPLVGFGDVVSFYPFSRHINQLAVKYQVRQLLKYQNPIFVSFPLIILLASLNWVKRAAAVLFLTGWQFSFLTSWQFLKIGWQFFLPASHFKKNIARGTTDPGHWL